MDDLTYELYEVLPEGPAYYPAGTVVDHPEGVHSVGVHKGRSS